MFSYNSLLELGEPMEASKTLQTIDAEVDNAEVVPIGAPPLEDITKMAQITSTTEGDHLDDNSDDSEKTVDCTETQTEIANQSDDSSDKTVDYTKNRENIERSASTKSTVDVTSPKGNIHYKHYGIKRQSL